MKTMIALVLIMASIVAFASTLFLPPYVMPLERNLISFFCIVLFIAGLVIGVDAIYD